MVLRVVFIFILGALAASITTQIKTTNSIDLRSTSISTTRPSLLITRDVGVAYIPRPSLHSINTSNTTNNETLPQQHHKRSWASFKHSVHEAWKAFSKDFMKWMRGKYNARPEERAGYQCIEREQGRGVCERGLGDEG
jgi:hypothetical protein